MLQIDTRQSRDDLFGINKGEAQVIDPSIFLRKQEIADQQDFARKQAAQKISEDRVNAVNGQLAGLNKIAVLDRERPMFAQMQSDLYDNVKKNIGRIRSGDNNALLDVQKQIGDIYTKAELSKNTREQLEKYNSEMLTKGFDKYRQPSLEYMHDYATNPEYNGNYNFDASKINERFDYADHVNKDLVGYAHEQAPNDRGYKSNTAAQRKEIIIDDINSDPIKLREANDAFEEAKDKMGAKTSQEFMANKFEKNLLVNDKPQLSAAQINGNDTSKLPAVSVTHHNDNKSDVAFTSKPNESYEIEGTNGNKLAVSSPTAHYENGKLVGGTAVDLNIQKQNDKKGLVFQSKIEGLSSDLAKQEQVFQNELSDAIATDDKDAQTAITAKAEETTDIVKRQIEREKALYQKSLHDVNIKLTPQQTFETIVKATGDKPDDILNGKAKKVNVQEFDNRKKEEPTQEIKTGKSKSGKDIISTDGGKTWNYR